MMEARVDINGQFGLNNPCSAFNSENVTIDRTLASSDAPRTTGHSALTLIRYWKT
jgi:hypothetical protein